KSTSFYAVSACCSFSSPLVVCIFFPYATLFRSLAAELQDAMTALASQDAAAVAKLQRHGRVLVEDLAIMLQAAILIQHAPREIAESFVLARMIDNRGLQYGAIDDD